MSFDEKLQGLITRAGTIKDNIFTEEATKTSLIMPFFQMLGYDVFNPMEFVPEYTADVGIKKGEKVDYAIFSNGELSILIEAKSVSEKLDRHDGQLFRYFGTTAAKFAILTNGLVYRFYTDLEEKNKMDQNPFFEFNLLDINDNEIIEIKKFCKENFDLNKILDTASELKYLNLIKRVLKEQFSNPSDEFVRYILSCNVYEGTRTQGVVDKYKPIVKKSLTQYINDLVNDKIKNALNTDDKDIVEEVEIPVNTNEIVTTEDELQSFYIVKSILRGAVPLDRISYKDNVSYFAVLIDKKVSKWVCRMYFKENSRHLIIPNSEQPIKYQISCLEDIYELAPLLIERVSKMIN